MAYGKVDGVRLRLRPRNEGSEFDREVSARLGYPVAKTFNEARALARGVVGKREKNAEKKQELDRKRTFQFEETQQSKRSVFAGIKRFFTKARGNR
jgi:hypothetical protein